MFYSQLLLLTALVTLEFSIDKCRATNVENIIQAKSTYHSSTVYKGKRYRLSFNKLTYNEALKKCENDNSILATIDSSNISKVIDVMLENSHIKATNIGNLAHVANGTWIGLKLDDLSKSTGTWADGTSYSNATSYSKWTEGEPKTLNAPCVQLWRLYLWSWDDIYCNLKRHFICEDQDPISYTSRDVENMTQSIFHLANLNTPNKNDIDKLSSHINTFLDIPASIKNISNLLFNDLLKAVENTTNNYNLSLGDYTINRKNMGIEILDVYANDTNSTGVELGEDLEEGFLNAASMVYISPNLLSEASKMNSNNINLQISSVVYRNPSLFNTLINKQSSYETMENPSFFGEEAVARMAHVVISHIISVEVKNTEMQDLQSPLIVTHLTENYDTIQANKSTEYVTNAIDRPAYDTTNDITINPENDTAKEQIFIYKTVFKCVFWDFQLRKGKGDWSDKGCKRTNITYTKNGMKIQCSCNHMTHFAIILDISKFYHPKYLTALTTIGCILSIVCVTVTASVNLYFKQLRTKPTQQILIHLCFSLILLHLVFLIGIDRTDDDALCFGMTVMLHYSILLLWGWMLVEGIFLFKTLAVSSVVSVSSSQFIWIAAVLCYVVAEITFANNYEGIIINAIRAVLPGFIVVAVVMSAEDYQSSRYCWLTGKPLLYSVVIPIGVILFINCIIFFIVMYSITIRSHYFQRNLDSKRLSQTLRRALCMMFVLGVPWILGYIMLLTKDDETRNILSTLFTICNAFQGVAIFILYCVRQENVKNLWTKEVRSLYQQTFHSTKIQNFTGKFTNQATLDSHDGGLASPTIFPTTNPAFNNCESTRPPPLPPKPQQAFSQPQTRNMERTALPFRHGWVN